MRFAAPAAALGILLLAVSLGGGAVMDEEPSGPVEKYRYDIHVDRTPYGSPDGDTTTIADLHPEVRETVTAQINANPIIDFKFYDTIYLESSSGIAQIDYVEYRGLYYRVDVEDHGLVEMMATDDMFSPYSVAGAWGIMLLLYGGSILGWRAYSNSRKTNRGEAE